MSWELKFDTGRDPVSGSRQTRYRSFRGTKREADVELRRLLVEIDGGQFTEPTKMTLGEYLLWWLEVEAKQYVSPKTLQGYSYIVEKHVIPTLGMYPLAKLRSLHVQKYYTDKMEGGRINGNGGLSAQSVRHHDRLLNVALKRARSLGLITRNPIEDVKRPKVADRDVDVLDDDEIARLLGAAESTRLYGPIFLALTTGLRRGEILGLRWQDVDLDRAALAVRQSIEQTKAGLRIKEPKTKKSRRNVALPAVMVEWLRAHKRQQAEERLSLGLGKSKADLVFTEMAGGIWPPDMLSRQFGNLVRAAGLRGVTFHGLRHTHITNLLKEGVHPKIASERAGHSSVAVTMDVYSHVVEGMQEEAASMVDISIRRALQGRLP
jgi:integrase